MYQAFYEVSNNTQQFISRCIGGIHKSSSFNYSNYGVCRDLAAAKPKSMHSSSLTTLLLLHSYFISLSDLSRWPRKISRTLCSSWKTKYIIVYSDLTLNSIGQKILLLKRERLVGLEMTNEPKNKGDESRWGT